VAKLPQGDELKKEMTDRGISIDGLEKNANYQPFEAAMQERLLDVMRDERDERALLNAEALTRFTRSLVIATWAVAIASAALIFASVAQIVIALERK
jgi:hypothetical protein